MVGGSRIVFRREVPQFLTRFALSWAAVFAQLVDAYDNVPFYLDLFKVVRDVDRLQTCTLLRPFNEVNLDLWLRMIFTVANL